MKSTWESMTRRQALAGVAGLAALPAAARHSDYRPSVSAQFYVWTQYFQRQKQTVAEGVESALAATRRAGYHRVELLSQFFEPAAREKTLAALRSYRLQAPVVYGAGVFHEKAAAEKTVADLLRLAGDTEGAGTRMIVTNPNPKRGREAKTDEELEIEALHLNQLGAALQKRDMHLLVHHHAPEMAANAREWRYILNHTEPKLVSLCLDLDWVRRGQQDPLALLREAGSRLGSLHLRNTRDGVWTENFGDGDIDYRPVAAHLRQIKFAGYLAVELAYEKATVIQRTLEEDLKLSRLYTEKIFGVKA